MQPLRIAFDGPAELRQAMRQAAVAARHWRLAEGTFAAADAAFIAGPLENRARLALETLQAGKHVLLDVPPTNDWPAFDALLAEANARDLRLGAALPLRHQPACAEARDRVALMPPGFPSAVLIEIAESEPGLWASALPVAEPLGLGAQLLDLVRWTLGTEPQSVEPLEVPGATRAWKAELGHMASGVQLCWRAEAPSGGWRITFSHGTESIVLEAPQASVAELLHPVLNDFAAACAEGREPLCNAADLLSATGVARAALKARQTRQRVAIIEHHYEHELDAQWEREHRKPKTQ